MDKAGRILLAKPLRDRLGLREGSELEVRETAEGVVLRPSSLIQKRGLAVHTGKLPPGFDIVRAVQDDREERIRKLAGL